MNTKCSLFFILDAIEEKDQSQLDFLIVHFTPTTPDVRGESCQLTQGFSLIVMSILTIQYAIGEKDQSWLAFLIVHYPNYPRCQRGKWSANSWFEPNCNELPNHQRCRREKRKARGEAIREIKSIQDVSYHAELHIQAGHLK